MRRGLRGPLGLILLSTLLIGCSSRETTPPQNGISYDALHTPYPPGLVELVPDGLPSPPMPANPTQGERGALVYFLICMPCHGDWGQGLTDGWRAEWGEDQNCWKSKCHASNHPPSGFELPHTIPGVLGSNSLLRFETAAGLGAYVQATMPWWNPGSLSSDQVWEVTAYLMHARGELDESAHLDPGTAPIYRLHTPTRALPSSSRAGFVLALPLLLALLLLVARGGHRR